MAEGMAAGAPPGIDPVRLAKVEELRRRGIDPYQYSYPRTHTIAEVRERFEASAGHEPGSAVVRLAGRVMAHRHMGKVVFSDLEDGSGRMQLYGRQDDLGAEAFRTFVDLDLGDFVGAEGKPFKTRKGEFSVWLSSLVLLTKALRPLPDKWHGLRDVEIRYRHRTLDMIANPEVRRIFRVKGQYIFAIRQWLHDRGYLEVDTPVLEKIYGGTSARPFVTHHNFLNENLYLRIALELPLKRLVAGGLEKVYEIGPVFRNEDVDATHQPEFIMFELYEAYVDYTDIMRLTETMVSDVAKEVVGTTEVTFQGTPLRFTPPWPRRPMVQLVDEALDTATAALSTDELGRVALKQVAAARAAHRVDAPMAAKVEEAVRGLGKRATRGYLINDLFEVLVQPSIIQPTIVQDYPVEVSPLTKQKRGDPTLAERFEPFCMGVEMGNAYSELTDPLEQRRRFEEQLALMTGRGEDEERWLREIDEEFMLAMEVGMPPMGGLGLGLERILMFLLDQPSLKEIVPFPAMRSPEVGTKGT